jgi:subtilisin family serine protease
MNESYAGRRLARLVVVAVCVTMLAVPLASFQTSAAPKMTLEVRETWDTDMINSDVVHGMGYTGKGVYVAVLDTGLAPNWKDYFPADRIATDLGMGFREDIMWDEESQMFVETGVVYETSWIGSRGATHGTHVTSTIIGYNYYAPNDAAAGYPIPPVFVNGVAPDVTIIPVKVLSDYTIGVAHLSEDYPDQKMVFGTSRAVAAGIDYATDLAMAGYRPMIVTMSLGGPELSTYEQDAIDRAVSNGVIVVASAGNEGTDGMGYPGAYAPVISVGASGWRYEWYHPDKVAPSSTLPRYRLWWLQDNTWGYNDVTEDGLADDVYIAEWSSRELAGQELDVVAPGSWVRGPYPGTPGYAHLPWWSSGWGSLVGLNPGNYYYVGGTSMACPHVTGVAALMLEKNPDLTQAEVESILKSTALPIMPGSMEIYDLSPTMGWYTYSWGEDATGEGLIQADDAVAAA